jgi:flagellar FliJ protein
MAFKFKLERLKDLREHYEEMSRIELGKKIEERLEIEKEIVSLNKKIDAFSLEFKNEIKKSVSVSKLTNMIDYKKQLNSLLSNLVIKLNQKIREEEIARNNYLNAKKEKDVLQKLQDRRFESYKTDEKRKDIKELDEIAQINYFTRGRENRNE